MIYLYATLITLLNLAFWASILFGMPGIWLMVLTAALIDWLQPEVFMFSRATLYVSAGLALLAEILEFMMGAAGARQAGGSKRGAALAIVGGVIGAILGTALPIPVLGTLIGASAGAFLRHDGEDDHRCRRSCHPDRRGILSGLTDVSRR
jgi:uncharacterized protein YqgC (DUF456 family)